MLSVLLAIAFQFQGPQPDLIAHPKLPIGAYVLAPLVAQQELVLGPTVHSAQFYGYYAEFLQRFKPVGNDNNLPPNAPYYEDERVGYMSETVANYPHDNKPAILIQTDGDYKQAMQLMPKRYLNFDNKQRISYWLSPDGKLLQVNSVISVSAGNWVMSATFGKDSYDLYLNDPLNGERKTTVYPAGGVEVFDAMFKPMLKGKDELLKTKEFYELDPITGSPIKYKATVVGRWDGKSYGKPTSHGHYVDLEGNGKKLRVYVGDEGLLYRVEEPDHHFLGLDDLPSVPVGG